MVDIAALGPPVIQVAHRELNCMGQVVIAPTSEADPLIVIVEGFTNEAPYHVPSGYWSSRGSALPQVGNMCLVCFDENGEAWVPMWSGASAIPDPTTALVPVGTIIDFAGAGTPPGPALWHLADGSSQLRVGPFAPLFAVLGTTWGSIDGAHFKLPDLRALVVVGAGQNAVVPTGSWAVGQHGGEESHRLLAGESGLPGTTTGTDSPDHAHFAANSASFLLTGAVGALAGGGSANFNTSNVTTGASARHSHSVGPLDAASAHNIMQPFAVIPKWIRYG